MKEEEKKKFFDLNVLSTRKEGEEEEKQED